MIDIGDPHLRYFTYARNIAKDSNYRIPVGCCIVRKGTPIGTGCNKIRYSREWAGRWKHTLHAECSALKLVGTLAKKSIVYIYREKKNGLIGNSRPCPDCMQKLKEAGVKAIYYSVESYPYWSMEKL